MIKCENIFKSFDGRTILEDISVEFESGKTNLIIGRSGSGKTVLLKTLVGLHEPDTGSIFYDDKNNAYALVFVVLDPTFSPFEAVEGDVKFTNIEEALQKGALLEEIVFGDAEYNEEEAYMGILQYRLTLNPKCKSISLTLPEYTMSYPYQSWLSTRQSGEETIVSVSTSSSASGRITFYGSNNYNVVLQLIVVYNAE
jgi:ABC-type cobalamin/Fe3+-siderophores transport system ATPase subunit